LALTGTGFAIASWGPKARFSLRLRDAAAVQIAEAAGFRLDQPMLRCVEQGNRVSARLRPDEWLLIGPEADSSLMATELETALAGHVHSLVDVSHAYVGATVAGTHATAILNAGCPLDLRDPAFPVGSATRTLLAKAEIVLIHRDATSYLVEYRRSFAAYVAAFLREAARDVGGA